MAQAWFDAAITKSGASTTTESYAGSTMTVFEEDGAKAAFVLIDSKVAVAGDLVSVKAAIDTKGTQRVRRAARSEVSLRSVDRGRGRVRLRLAPSAHGMVGGTWGVEFGLGLARHAQRDAGQVGPGVERLLAAGRR